MRFLVLAIMLFSNSAYSFDLTNFNTRGSIIENPYVMSITAVIAVPKENNFERDRVSIIPSRVNVPLMSEHASARIVYRLQTKLTAPFVFVLPGTGGNQNAPAALFIAEKMYKLGYHVVTVSNPFSWAFTLSSSTRGLPGYTPEDSQDLYVSLKKVASHLQRKHGIKPASYNLVGYSLGGLQAVFIKDIDEKTQHFNFKNVLSINPAVDVVYGIRQLDTLFARGNRLSEARKNYVYGRVLEVGNELMERKESLNDIRTLQAVFDKLNFNNDDLAYLIGQSFRESLRDVIYASQQVKDLGILKSPISEYRRNARIDEAATFSYVDYLGKFIFPEVSKSRGLGQNFEEINAQSSMYQYADFIKARPNLYLMHSSDDFILRASDLQFLKDNYGDRALILPYGGHCGGLNFPQFDGLLKKIFANN